MFQTLARAGRKFWNYIKPHKKWGLVSFLFFVIGGAGIFLFGATALAQVADAAQYENTLLVKVATDIMIWIAGFFIQATVFIMDFVIEIAGYGNFINSKAVLFGWTLIRDVANMFFVVILLVIAFGTVLGVEAYSWKKLLVKFVLAAVLVNFSRIICGVIIDAAQVFMMTFLNGVAAVAGGNIISAFKLDQVLSFSPSTAPEILSDISVLGSAIACMFFAAIAAFTIGAYLIVLLARVVSLWILIILSPLAFVLSIIPKTQSYSGQWWTEFTNNVIAGPILAFFLWLSFAVVGDGMVHDEFISSPFQLNTASQENIGNSQVMGGLSAVMEWGNLANFLIAVGLLLAGVKATQKLGVAGAGMLGSAVEVGKKAATVLTGVAAGKWLAQKGWEGAKGGLKLAAMNVPFVGGKSWIRRGRDIAGRVSSKFQEVQYAREQAAKGMDKWGAGEKGAKGLIKRLAGGVAGGIVGTDLRAEEASKQWGKFAAMKKERRMEDLGLGSREVGKETLKEKARVDTIKAQSAVAKDRWYNKALVDFYEAPKELSEMQTTRGGLSARESAEQTIIQEASLEIANAQAELEKSKDDAVKVKELNEKITQQTAIKESAEQNLSQIDTKKKEIDQRIDGIFKDDAKWNNKNLLGRDILQQRIQKEKNVSDLAAAQGMMELSYLATDEGKKAQASAAESKIMQQQMGETVNAQKQLTELKKIEELLRRPQPAAGTKEEQARADLAMRYQSLQEEMYSTKAGSEQLRIDQSRESEKKLAMARDEKLKESNQLPRYLSQVLQKHNKEDIDMYSSKNFDQMMANIDFLSSQIDKEQDLVKKTIMQKDLQNWMVAADNRGADFGLAALNRTKKNKDVDSSSVDSVRAAHLSSFLGEEVEQTSAGVTAAMEKLKKMQGENFDAFMTNYVNGLSLMADGGAIAHGGLYKMVLDKTTGRQAYIPTNAESDKEVIKSKKEYHLGQARAAGKGFLGALDYKGGKFVLDSDESIKNAVSLIGGRNSQGYTTMNKMNVDSLNVAIENTTNEEYLRKLYNGLKSSVPQDKDMIALLKRFTKTNLEKIKKLGVELPKDWKEVKEEIEDLDEGNAE